MTAALKPGRALKIREVSEQVGFGRSWIYEAIKDPLLCFPAPNKTRRSSRWDKNRVLEWQANYQAAIEGKEVTSTRK